MAINHGMISVVEFIESKTGEKTSPSEIIRTWNPVAYGYRQDYLVYGRALTLEHPKTGLRVDVSISIVPKGYLWGRGAGFCIESDVSGQYYTGTCRVAYKDATKVQEGLQKIDAKQPV